MRALVAVPVCWLVLTVTMWLDLLLLIDGRRPLAALAVAAGVSGALLVLVLIVWSAVRTLIAYPAF